MLGLTRRSVLTGLAGSLAAPALAETSSRVLRFIPRDDVGVLDPHWSTSGGTRTHAFLVFDTLFGQDAQQRITPQMVQTVATEEDGRRWRQTLRDGLRFHDGEAAAAAMRIAYTHLLEHGTMTGMPVKMTTKPARYAA